ncbi:hypothetical protein AMELA_G00123310 [Ameiurus melas]|uniref:Uncharacterized protein n=1 Tax=Ameiurus melas TaxID=219545 RepID=A0A7J6AM70_AMEME|nr:hypothetical protein AMELA_G00123310 [Ameiurus melas]
MEMKPARKFDLKEEAQPWALAFLTFTQRWAAVPLLALRSDRALSCCFLFLYHLPGCEAQCAATDRMRCQACKLSPFDHCGGREGNESPPRGPHMFRRC